VIDTRDPDVYAKGHLPGAVNLREIFTYLATSDPDGLAAMKGKLDEAFGAAGLSGKERSCCARTP
jgi:thiosulfate/3-mercaptopyruvate sulfurtransferase